MKDLLYIIAVILVIAWAIGFFGFSAGGLIHVLLVIAVIAILVRASSNRTMYTVQVYNVWTMIKRQASYSRNDTRCNRLCFIITGYNNTVD